MKFHAGNCVITDVENGQVIGVGEVRKGLYYLVGKRMNLCGAAMTSQKGSTVAGIDKTGRRNVVVTSHVPSHMQLADMLTKPLGIKQQSFLLRKLGVSASTSTPLEGE